MANPGSLHNWVESLPGDGRYGAILVDTSIWIESFRRSSDLGLEAVVDLDEGVVVELPFQPTAEFYLDI